MMDTVPPVDWTIYSQKRPEFLPGKPRKPGLHGGACHPLALPPLQISPRPPLGSPRQSTLKPWGGREPRPWMLSPRETTYKRQCTDTQDFLKTKMLEGREDILAMCDGEEAKELLKSPRERIVDVPRDTPEGTWERFA